jgi:8-hydroxy-5-deazaflavin:NADPH oxidoreductase
LYSHAVRLTPKAALGTKEHTMKIGVMGTGMVGQQIAAALSTKGHQVMIGTRDVSKSLANNEVNGYGLPGFGVWHKDHQDIQVGTFAQAAAFGELIVNATNGVGSLEALNSAGANNLDDKILIDIANDLDFSKGMPPRLAIADEPGSSLGERIQNAFPNAKVVKTLSTMNAFVMVNPSMVSGETTVFINGNDASAKQTVTGILESFGWKDIMDLGDISASRSVEFLLPIWLRLWGVIGNTPFNFKILR